MIDLLPSLITLAALLGAFVWYLTNITTWRIQLVITALIHAMLCMFGGFIFSAASIKLSGGFANPLIPALLVCTGTALCVLAHTLLQKRNVSTNKSLPE
ncbi:hypothetical protein ACFVYJ_03315 [Pontibacter sp. JAM-7]|uniref:hypothetical protein n=1 Tax=Pontibacter sp. JAM-7 TaxID=3366581 RepID=UPI003AF59299